MPRVPIVAGLVLALVTAATPSLQAQEPSAAAQAYMNASGFAGAIQSVIPSIVAQEEQALRQALPDADEDAGRAYLGLFEEELIDRLPELERRAATLADAAFSPQELSALTDFFRTDLGRKFVAENVRAQQALFELIDVWAAWSADEAAQRAQARLEEQGLSL